MTKEWWDFFLDEHHLTISQPPLPSTQPQWTSDPAGHCLLPWLESITLTSISFPTGRFKLQYSRWCRGFLRCNQSVWEFWKYDSHLFHQSLLLWEASSRKSRGKLASVRQNLHSRPDYCCPSKLRWGKEFYFVLVSPPSHPPFSHFFPLLLLKR